MLPQVSKNCWMRDRCSENIFHMRPVALHSRKELLLHNSLIFTYTTSSLCSSNCHALIVYTQRISESGEGGVPPRPSCVKQTAFMFY